MTYTKEFEEWTDGVTKSEGPSYLDKGYVTRKDAAHFWLSAFARLVREEAKPSWHFHDEECESECLGIAFNTICERFGLERE